MTCPGGVVFTRHLWYEKIIERHKHVIFFFFFRTATQSNGCKTQGMGTEGVWSHLMSFFLLGTHLINYICWAWIDNNYILTKLLSCETTYLCNCTPLCRIKLWIWNKQYRNVSNRLVLYTRLDWLQKSKNKFEGIRFRLISQLKNS